MALPKDLSCPIAMLTALEEAQEALKKSVDNKPILVYRVEGKTNRLGPYRAPWEVVGNKLALSIKLGALHTNEEHRGIRPIIALIGNKSKAAMKNLRGLKKWFSGLEDDIIAAKYTIGVYEAREWVEWYGQIVFNPRMAKRIASLPACILKGSTDV